MNSTSDGLRGLDADASEAERSRAEYLVQESYADGQIEQDEFESRIGVTLTAVSRRELNAAVRGIRPVTRRSLSEEALHPPVIVAASSPAVGIQRRRAALAHLSGLATVGLGPLIAYAVSDPGSYERREAAKAFNFQLSTAGVALALTLPWRSVWAWTDTYGTYSPAFLVLVVCLALNWGLGTLSGASNAMRGSDSKHILLQLVRFEVLREGTPLTAPDPAPGDDQIESQSEARRRSTPRY